MDEKFGWSSRGMALFQGADAEILEEGNPEKVLNLLQGKLKRNIFSSIKKKILLTPTLAGSDILYAGENEISFCQEIFTHEF